MTQLSRFNPKSWLAIALISVVSALLGACGGGGATATFDNGLSPLEIQPPGATIYAGVPYTISFVGGRGPYSVASSNFTIIPINEIVYYPYSLTFVAANPGVTDTGQDPKEVPKVSVDITVRDSGSGQAATQVGTSITRKFSVLQNFLTGYAVGYTSTCSTTTTSAGQACAGLESLANIAPVTSGILSGDRSMRVERLSGDFDFVVEGTNLLPSTLNFTTDHSGVGHVRLKVRVGAVTQIATYRLIDVASTVNVVEQFVIVGGQPPGTLTLIPNMVTFTGSSSTRCGTGSADVLIFDGKPPFTIQNTEPNLTVSPLVVTDVGGKFTVTAFNPTLCLSGATVVVSDFEGRRATLTVTTAVGTTTATVLSVSPSSVTLTCAANVATVAVVGGTGFNTAISSSSRVTATVSGTSMQITRLLGDGATGPFPTAVTVTVTDGTTSAAVAVTSPPSCP